jgi:Sulfotransferase family
MMPVEALIERAEASTGLSDFGAPGWQEGLERLVDAATTDLTLDPATEARLENKIDGRLTNRLLIESWYNKQQMESPEIDGLVVIHGLPRTATTVLQFLLTQGPDFRYQRRWEINSPVPPAEATSDADDTRRIAAVAKSRGVAEGSPLHISELDGPVDDNTILGLDFHNQELALPLPTYTTWWRESSLKSTYAYHERVLRMLHSGRGPYHWIVKAPYHNFHLSDLAAQYPDARFVMAHRDPSVLFPSACSTVASAQRDALPLQPPDPIALGSFLLEHLVKGVNRAIDDRERIGDHRFVDVTQQQVETDTVGTVERIYDFLGLSLDSSTRAAIDQWALANRRGARGPHRYSAEEYGLTGKEIRDAFRRYMDRFDIELESG